MLFTRRLTLLMAITCGASAAGLWYAQPLLTAIADRLGVRPSAAGLVVTAAQLGYVAGLLAVVPRSDTTDRRRLVVGLLGVGAVALVVCAAAPVLAVLVAATAAVGVSTAVAQVLVPLAGELAAEEERGRAVGTVMSGLLIGILAARTVSGVIEGLAGWRAVYLVAALLLLLLAVALWRALPLLPRHPRRAGSPLGHVARLVREEPVLRARMAYGALGLGGFSMLWTALTLLLSEAPYAFSPPTIGAFGVAGLAGALAAQGAGRLADRGLAHQATAGFWLVVLAGWALVLAGTAWLPLLILGLVVIDAGMQGANVTNQSVIYALRPDARGAVTTAYVASGFTGASAGSALATLLWPLGGWTLVCATGAAIAVLALAGWAHGQSALNPRASYKRRASSRRMSLATARAPSRRDGRPRWPGPRAMSRGRARDDQRVRDA